MIGWFAKFLPLVFQVTTITASSDEKEEHNTQQRVLFSTKLGKRRQTCQAVSGGARGERVTVLHIESQIPSWKTTTVDSVSPASQMYAGADAQLRRSSNSDWVPAAEAVVQHPVNHMKA
jgi:hypothetical protein